MVRSMEEDDRQQILNTGDDILQTDAELDGRQGGQSSSNTRGCFYVPCRYILVVMMFLVYFLSLAQRMCFNLALIAMVNFTDQNSSSNETIMNIHHYTSRQFNWDADVQGLMLGAFYYGYPISQLPGGYIAEKYSAKYIMAFVGMGTGLFSLLVPVTADWSPYALFVLRILQGLCQGALFPAGVVMIGRWFAVKDRNTATAIIGSGTTVGIVVSQAVTGFLCELNFLGGWPSVFYIFGGLSVLWSAVWILLIYDKPQQHPRMSEEEKIYIARGTEGLNSATSPKPPWCRILRSKPVWGILIFRFLDAFSYYVIFNCIPIYIKQVLKINLEENSILASLPYIAQIFMVPLVGWFADFIWKKEILGIVTIRRSATVIGELCAAGLLVLVGFVGSSTKLVVTLLVLNKALGSFLYVGPDMSLYDIAPVYAGSLTGLINGIANLQGFIAPQVVAAITDNSSNILEWRMIFLIGGVISALGTLIYCLTATKRLQEWAKLTPEVDTDAGPTPDVVDHEVGRTEQA